MSVRDDGDRRDQEQRQEQEQEQWTNPGDITPEMVDRAEEMTDPNISDQHRRTLRREQHEARKEEQRRKARAGTEHQPYFAPERQPTDQGADIQGEQIAGNQPPRNEGDINQESKYKR